MSVCCRPDICISGILCENSKTTFCCWHKDIRTNKNIIYIDTYGEVNLTKFKLSIPPDLYYCPSCKITKEKPSDIIDNVITLLPPPNEYNRIKQLESNRKKEEIIRKQRETEENNKRMVYEKLQRLFNKLREKEQGLKKKK